MKEKRRRPRIESINLIAYACLDENDNVVNQGMGRTLNVSELGILIETYFELDSQNILLIDIGIGDDLVDIKGRVVHSNANDDKKYESGIEFISIDEDSLAKLKKYIEAFNKMREK